MNDTLKFPAKDTLQVLTEARAVISNAANWGKHYLVARNNDCSFRYCAAGAVGVAMADDACSPTVWGSPAMEALREAIPVKWRSGDTTWDAVTSFNNFSNHELVLKMFDTAIERQRQLVAATQVPAQVSEEMELA